jgi:hypothetical protein
MFDRNARWLLEKEPTLENLDPKIISDADRLARSFKVSFFVD